MLWMSLGADFAEKFGAGKLARAMLVVTVNCQYLFGLNPQTT